MARAAVARAVAARVVAAKVVAARAVAAARAAVAVAARGDPGRGRQDRVTSGARPTERCSASSDPQLTSQFASSRWPPSVSTDSGWNWTP